MNVTSIVAYLALFATVGFLFVFVSLLLGRFLRWRVPTPEKQAIYECGEPTIGPGFVQFDLRFYVVALLFIIFDVEVALFFPWATVFGKANQLADPNLPKFHAAALQTTEWSPPARLSSQAAQKLGELGVKRPRLPAPGAGAEENKRRIESWAGKLALTAMADIGVFFAVLMVGFAYVWKRGDLSWVRAVDRQSSPEATPLDRSAAAPETQ